jgi:Cupredoxin-like domain
MSVSRWPAVFVAGLLLVAGCTPSAAGPCEATSVALEATVTDEAMDPSALAVCRGQELTLELHSQTDGVFHIHGYDHQVPATSLTPGQTTTLEFTTDAAGQFIIELHALSGEEGEIGVLTVNEP